MNPELPTLSIAFFAGFLSFISPCVLPLVPAYIGYMGGRVTNTVASQVLVGANGQIATRTPSATRFTTLTHGLFFVLGFTILFVIVGMITSVLLSQFRDIISRLGGVVIIFFGLHFMGILSWIFSHLLRNKRLTENVVITPIFALVGMTLILWGLNGTRDGNINLAIFKTVRTTAGEYSQLQIWTVVSLILIAVFLMWLFLSGAFTNPGKFWNNFIGSIQNVLYADTRPQIQTKGSQGYLSSALMGIIFAAGWTPCTGPILGSILGVAATSSGGSAISSGALLISYSLGLGIPFLLAAFMLDRVQGGLRRLQRHMHKIELITGGFLVLIGILVASEQLQILSQQLSGKFSDLSIRVEDCGLGTVNGEIEISYLGSCLSGENTLIKIGNTIQNSFTKEVISLQYIFHGSKGDDLNIEMKDQTGGLNPYLKLFNNQKTEIASSVITNDEDKNVALINNVIIPEDGIYTLVATRSPDSIADIGSFTIRAVYSQVDEQQSAQTTLNSLAGAAAAVKEPLSGTDIGNVAPNFESVTDTGKSIKLSDLRGQVVVLNFWATWCAPCKVEMPEFEKAYKANGNNNFTVLAINNSESLDQVKTFRKQLNLSFPMVMDEKGELQRQYGVISYPSTYVLNKVGVIIAKQLGPMTGDQIDTLVTKALAS